MISELLVVGDVDDEDEDWDGDEAGIEQDWIAVGRVATPQERVHVLAQYPSGSLSSTEIFSIHTLSNFFVRSLYENMVGLDWRGHPDEDMN